MNRDEWVKALRAEIVKRIEEYEGMSPFIKANGFARLALADSIAEMAATNASLLIEPS